MNGRAARVGPTDDRRRSSANDGAVSVPMLLGTLLTAKLAVVAVVVWASSDAAWPLLIATTWIWLLAAALLGQGVLLFRWRLLRARSRRAQLVQAEWMSAPDHAARSRVKTTNEPTGDAR
ncbi:MAG: hypothetical protein M3464_09355 [Chloroflexota bacterium]|nr:hypothetical protein [Chloroflexota bacterium]